MNDPQRVDEAQNAVKQILAALQIARVVCVDDTYEDEPQLEEVIVAARSLDAGTLRKALPELGDSIPDDQDVLKEQIRRILGALDKAIRSDRAKVILAAAGPQDNVEADDRKDALILDELTPKEMLLTLSPKQWEERRDKLLKADADQRTLFLFDQDLSKNGGDVEGGIKIIASLLLRKDAGNIICGLLTHTVTPENQPKRWVELSETYSIPRDRFLVIPKQHLKEDPVIFAQILKLVALSPDFAELKQKTGKIIADAASTATSRVDAISIYDLDHIVFQVSAEEGLWEPDMLFRLYALYHRLESRRLAHEGGELEAIARRLRLVSDVPTETSFRPVSSTWKIQRDELYEAADYLNKNHLPLELGDIFAKTGTDSKKHYILLAQPCDLMVRKNGERQPELVHVPLAEVTLASPASASPHYAEEMGCFGDSPNERWYVKLKQVHQVRVCLLDLCVFNNDGTAIIQLNGEAPDAIRPAWKARYTIIEKPFGRLLKRLDLLSPVEKEPKDVTNIKAKLKSELTGDLLNEGLFKGEMVDKNACCGIAYNCRRVGRLTRARAFGLLMAYTACLNRPAYDRDFV